MAENKSKRLFDLKENKTEFQCRGVVTGVGKKGFFQSKKTKNNSNMNLLSFGVQVADGETIYMTLNGMERKSVYYYSKDEKKTVAVDWKNRSKAPGDGYRLMGVSLGLEKDADGNNIKYTMTDYDAADYCSKHLKDDVSVFVKGNVEYSSYKDQQGETKRSVKFIPNQISLCKEPIHFDAEDYKTLSDFKTNLIFQSIEKEKDDKGQPTGLFAVEGVVVTYSTIENVVYYIRDEKLAGLFKKNLKPYYSLEVTGRVEVQTQIEEVEVEDSWGEKSSYDRISTPTRRLFVITGAKPKTIDKAEEYTEDAVDEARAKIRANEQANKSFGEPEKKKDEDLPWGTDTSDSEIEDDWA